jgi:hypothetical protein
MPPKPFQFLHCPPINLSLSLSLSLSLYVWKSSRNQFLERSDPEKKFFNHHISCSFPFSLSLSKTQERKKERKAKPAPSMADKKESKPHGEEETKIPVFTVLKNGAILKNIFIVNNHQSPSPPPSPSPPSTAQNPDQDHEEILTVGRHPDCSITLTHPSISRFHLQIHSNPSKQHLSVVDLSSGESFFLMFNLFLWFEILGFSSSSSSLIRRTKIMLVSWSCAVHGTWVSGKKAEPGMRVELKEEDTVRVGGSSREYRLHWVPLSRAYDLENPFVPPKLDVCMTEEKEEENAVETYQVRDLFFNSKSCRVPTSCL